jgi:peroxiredoxin
MNGQHMMNLPTPNPIKIMKAILSALLLATCLPCFAQSSGIDAPPSSPVADKSVDEILNRVHREQCKAFEAYLNANPQANDAGEVYEELIAHYGEIAAHYEEFASRDNESDDKKRQLDALERQYYFMVKRANADLGPVCQNIVARFFIVWKGPRATREEQEQAQALFDQGKKDFPKLKDDRWFCRQESKLKFPRVGETMAFTCTALDGAKVDTAALKGKVVLIYSWESSDERSLKVLPALKAMYQKLHGKGLEVVGIPFDTDEAALRKFIRKESIPWPQAFDGKGWENDVAVKYGLITVPLHFILGRDGKVADYEFLDGSELVAKVEQQLK